MSVYKLKINSVKKKKIKQGPLNTICYIQAMRCVGLWEISPVLFSLMWVWRVCFVNKCYWDHIKKIIITRQIVIIQMFLHAIFITWVFSTVIFIIIPSVTKVSNSLLSYLNSSLTFFLHYIINILRLMNKFLVQLMNQLFYKISCIQEFLDNLVVCLVFYLPEAP